MPIRTNAGRVQALLLPGGDYDLAKSPSLDPFMETASALIDDVKACAAADGKPLSEPRLELLERWCAAHFYKQSDQAYSSRSTGGSSGQFQGQTAMYLEGTKYGQTALSLDPSGCLYALTQEGNVASMAWLGKPKGRQIPYSDRRG